MIGIIFKEYSNDILIHHHKNVLQKYRIIFIIKLTLIILNYIYIALLECLELIKNIIHIKVTIKLNMHYHILYICYNILRSS